MTDSELLDLNKKGFIPGPSELEEDFLKRVAQTKKTYGEKTPIPSSHWDWARLFLREMFDFEPESLFVFYSNDNLRAWQGAAAWIEKGKIVSIQLRENLRKGSYLKYYKREEILAHEAVHAARSAFNEPQNEEFFAYMTSGQKWHKVLGPILKKPWEIGPFFIAMLMGALFPTCYLAATVWMSMGFFRLIRQHRFLRKASENILPFVGNQKTVRFILFRLTDEEISRFAKGERFDSYRKKQSCLRWRLINLAYPVK
jgi:hypothetical protein